MRRAVGIFFFLGLVILGAMALWVDDEMSLFGRGGSYYHVTLSSADGMQEGASVWLAGIQAGRIMKIDLGENDVKVHFRLRDGYRLREDSEVSMPATSLLASGRILSLTLGSPGAPYLSLKDQMPGPELKKVKPMASLDTLVAKADELFGSLKDAGPAIKEAAESVRNIAKKIEGGEGTLGKLINDPKLHDDLVGAVAKLDDGLASFKRISAKLEKGEGTLGKLLNDPKLYDELSGAVGDLKEGMASFKSVAAKIDKGEGTLGKLVNDEALYKDLSDASKGIAELARKVNSGEGTIGKLVSDQALYDELKSAASSMASVMRRIDSGEGSLGKLVNDDTLYVEATRLLREAREAVEDMREQAPITAFGSVIFGAFQ
ncbi:MAG: MlaD family protein [Planctomycetota bacterium]|jgi:phospholipid/cholesterol/gamma-HCH transport system substrate-binding protein